MELALYDPEHGYYASGVSRLGPEGDYVTASDSGRALGRCLARQIEEIDGKIGPFDPFDVVEFGAGRGLLARDILDAASEFAPALAGRLRYRMVDRSPVMRELCRANVPEGEVVEAGELGCGRRGVVLAVELFDALPVHRVRRREARLVEVLVDQDSSGSLTEIESPAPAALAAAAERYGAAAEEGTEAELAPGAGALLESMTGAFDRGVFIFVDYGDRADRLYGAANPDGTLLAYHRHQTSQSYLERVGEQDLTAHVNFSALEDRARELGLRVLGFTTQDRFLIANGILESFEQEGGGGAREVKKRLQAMQLIHPNAMGRRFKVLVLAKGCDESFDLDGLTDPFAR